MADLLIIFVVVVAAYAAVVLLSGQLLLACLRRPRRQPLRHLGLGEASPDVPDDFTLAA